MRRTILPPSARAASHAMSEANALPTCMRPDGEGAKRPTVTAVFRAAALESMPDLRVVR